MGSEDTFFFSLLLQTKILHSLLYGLGVYVTKPGKYAMVGLLSQPKKKMLNRKCKQNLLTSMSSNVKIVFIIQILSYCYEFVNCQTFHLQLGENAFKLFFHWKNVNPGNGPWTSVWEVCVLDSHVMSTWHEQCTMGISNCYRIER